MERKPIVLFDGVCNLCNNSVQFIIKRDSKNQFLFASLQGKTAKELLQQYGFTTDLHSFILIENNRAYSHSTAMLRVMKRLNGGWKLLYAFIIVPKFIRDACYRLIAKNRYKWFGKKDECMIPTVEQKERFLP